MFIYPKSLEGAVHLGQLLESALSEDHKSPEGAAWGQAQQVQAVHMGSLNTWDVAHSTSDAVVLVVDHLGLMSWKSFNESTQENK